MSTPATISFTAINDGAFYTIAELNELFRLASIIINSKLDAAINQELVNVVVGDVQVVSSGQDVILQDPTTARIYATWSANFKRIRNLKEGTAATDAITVGQAKALLGI